MLTEGIAKLTTNRSRLVCALAPRKFTNVNVIEYEPSGNIPAGRIIGGDTEKWAFK